jgi:hypothetical protein
MRVTFTPNAVDSVAPVLEKSCAAAREACAVVLHTSTSTGREITVDNSLLCCPTAAASANTFPTSTLRNLAVLMRTSGNKAPYVLHVASALGQAASSRILA